MIQTYTIENCGKKMMQFIQVILIGQRLLHIYDKETEKLNNLS